MHIHPFKFHPRLWHDLRRYNRQKFVADLIAGLVVGIVALPLAIAFAIAASPGGDTQHTIGPAVGIITAIVAGGIISAFGGSRVQIGGPTGAFIVIIYGIVAQFGLSGLLVATVMAGVFLLLLGFFRLGAIIKFIPYPIEVGFTSGIAVTIFTTQVKDLLGLSIEGGVPSDFLEKWLCYFQHFDSLSWQAAAVGIGTILIITLTPLLWKKLPASLIAIVVMTIAVYATNSSGYTAIETIGDRFGSITASLPPVTALGIDWQSLFTDAQGNFSMSTINQLVPAAIVIAVLGAIESLLSAAVADGVTGDHHDSNQELVGQGIANIVAPFFGGIPATGAIARTMTNINNGAKSPVAGIVHAAVLLLIFLLAMPLASYIPMSCLAGVLAVVSYNMSGWRTFLQLLRRPKSDVAVLLLTFGLTVIFDLTVAIEVGILLACLLFMRRVMESTHLSVFTKQIDPNAEESIDIELHEECLTIPDGVEVYEINGPFFFGVANRFEQLAEAMQDHPALRIIRMRKVPFIDSTGVHNLQNLIRLSQQQGTAIILSGVLPEVQDVLKRADFTALIGEENICDNIHIALARAETLLAERTDGTAQ